MSDSAAVLVTLLLIGGGAYLVIAWRNAREWAPNARRIAEIERETAAHSGWLALELGYGERRCYSLAEQSARRATGCRERAEKAERSADRMPKWPFRETAPSTPARDEPDGGQ